MVFYFKKLLVTTGCILSYVNCDAQNCDALLLKQNTSITTVSYRSDSTVIDTGRCIVTMVYKNKDTLVSKVKVEYQKKAFAECNLKCKNDTFFFDMGLLLPSQRIGANKRASITGDAVEIPDSLFAGQSLKDVSLHTEMQMGAPPNTQTNPSPVTRKMKMNYSIKNRKVEAKEKITTPAGTFDCYKITSDYITERIIGERSMPIKGKNIEWFSYELGMNIKTEFYLEEGKLIKYTLVTAIQK